MDDYAVLQLWCISYFFWCSVVVVCITSLAPQIGEVGVAFLDSQLNTFWHTVPLHYRYMAVPLSIFTLFVMNFLAPSYAWWIFGTPMMLSAVKTSILLAKSNYGHEGVEELASEVREKAL